MGINYNNHAFESLYNDSWDSLTHFMLLVLIFNNVEAPRYRGTICEATGNSKDWGCFIKQLLRIHIIFITKPLPAQWAKAFLSQTCCKCCGCILSKARETGWKLSHRLRVFDGLVGTFCISSRIRVSGSGTGYIRRVKFVLLCEAGHQGTFWFLQFLSICGTPQRWGSGRAGQHWADGCWCGTSVVLTFRWIQLAFSCSKGKWWRQPVLLADTYGSMLCASPFYHL